MKTYLISLFSPDGPPPADLDLTQVMADLEVVNADIRAAGGWVFAGGLADQGSATTIRTSGAVADAVLTDGPFVEAKEHLGGVSIVRSRRLRRRPRLGRAHRQGDRTAGRGAPVPGEGEPGQAPTDR